MSGDTTPGAARLANARFEAFCLRYAGASWGNGADAARCVGYSERTARKTASRLLTNADIATRVRWLRQQALEQLGADRLFLMERRMAIIRSPDTPVDLILEACRDVERGQGLAGPEKVAVEISGRLEQRHSVTPAPETLASLWSYIDEIRRDYAARAATPQQLEERRRRLEAQGRILPTGDGRQTPARLTATPAAPKPSPQLSPGARAQLQRTILAAPPATGGAASPTAR